MDSITIGAIIVAVPLGLIPAVIAHNKGHNFLVWWFFGWALFIIALPCALMLERNPLLFRRCPHCGSWLERGSTDEGAPYTKCRYCGSDLASPDDLDLKTIRAKGSMQWKPGEVVAIVIGVVIVLFLISPFVFSCNSGNGASIPYVGPPVVSLSEYNRIQNGMSYRDVVAIIGTEGTEISSNHIDGVPGVIEDIDTVMYEWRNPSGAGMNAIFQNNRLVSKSQFGL